MKRGSGLIKKLDRYIGIPLVYLLSVFKKHRKIPSKVTSVHICMFGAIGDTLLLIPVVSALEKKYGKIVFVCSKENIAILKNYPQFECLEIDIYRVLKNPLYLFRLRKIIAKTFPKVLLDFNPWARISPILMFFLFNCFTIGFKTRKQYRHYLYDSFCNHNDKIHELQNYYILGGQLIPNMDKTVIPVYELKKEAIQWVSKYIKEKNVNVPFIVFHPWAGGYKSYKREFSIAKNRKLLSMLNEKGYSVLITGSKEDRKNSHEIAKGLKNVYSVAGESMIEETAALIKESKLFISVNTGIMHIGAAVGANMIALHGPTDPTRWGPLGSNVNIIRAKLNCIPCLNLGFEYPKTCNKNCMDEIELNEIMNLVYSFME